MTSAFDEIRPDEYGRADVAEVIGRELISRVTEHAHLDAATIGYMFRDDEIRRQGRVIAAECILVERILQSEKRWSRMVKAFILHVLGCEELPDFLVLIDRNLWQSMDASERVALIDHELSHAAQATEPGFDIPKFHKDGTPVWTIRAHEIEEFNGVIERNGLWSEELREVARTIIDRLAAERPHKVA